MVVLGLAVLVLGVLGAVLYARHQDEAAANQDALDSRRQDFALCVVQNQAREDINENRKAIRSVTASTYALVAAVLRDGGPTDERLKEIFEAQLKALTKNLRAIHNKLPPIDCQTYVRPDLPPDAGVPSTP